MYTLEILDINYNDSDYEKYKKYKLNEKECHYIGDRESNSRVGIIKDINDEIKFFFKFNYIGLLPQVLFVPETKSIYLGAYNKVLCIDEKDFKILKQINNYEDIFFEIIEIEKKIVIIFEMSIYIINENGDIISSYDAPDVIEDYKIENNELKVKYSGLKHKHIILLDKL